MNQTTYEIHPAVGVARLGSCRDRTGDGVFHGPEPGGAPPEAYRDPAGDLKRQAARFRVFRCVRDSANRILGATEVTSRDARITWTVHLANRKATARRITGRGFRNQPSGVDGLDRWSIIDPGSRSVSTPGERRAFDTGRFRTTPVDLGEIRMEPDGRLLVLGGYGRSGSDPPQARLDFRTGTGVDNRHWYDDTSDGPVTATVRPADGTVRVATAWVVVGPPDFAPGVANLVTLYDYRFDRGVARGLLRAPTDPPSSPSFTRHVRPILERAMGYRWVNRFAGAGFGAGNRGHGPGGVADFSGLWGHLADPSPRAQGLRSSIAGLLRNPDPKGPRPRVPP